MWVFHEKSTLLLYYSDLLLFLFLFFVFPEPKTKNIDNSKLIEFNSETWKGK